MIKAPWHAAITDRKTGLISFTILALPLVVSVYLFFVEETKKKQAFSSMTVAEIVYDIEIMLDHVNGALINLSSVFTDCNENVINQMYRAAFDIPGVEGFVIVDGTRQVVCSNWLTEQAVGVDFPVSFGLSLSKEHFLRSVSKNGFYAYRTGANNLTYAAVISSTYLRYLLNQKKINVTDTLTLLQKDEETPVSISGLLSGSILQQARSLANFDGTVESIEVSDFNVTILSSNQHPSISVAYLSRKTTLTKTVSVHVVELALLIVGQLLALTLWLAHRFKALNSMKEQIDIAIDRKEFVPYLQPIVNLDSNEWVGAEMLARWQRNGKDFSYPNEFIPLAERHRRIKKITKQLAQDVFAFYDQNTELLGDFFISINLSPNHIDEKTILNFTDLKESFPNLKSDQIKLEITEHGLDVEKAMSTKTIIEKLREMGCQVGLDDFGTGQSGLEYFTHLAFDFIKIDRRFVDAIGKATVDFHLLKTIIQLAASLDLDVIAEGVETEEQSQWLKEHGVHYAQGWLYAKAMPVSEFEAVLKQKRIAIL